MSSYYSNCTEIRKSVGDIECVETYLYKYEDSYPYYPSYPNSYLYSNSCSEEMPTEHIIKYKNIFQ